MEGSKGQQGLVIASMGGHQESRGHGREEAAGRQGLASSTHSPRHSVGDRSWALGTTGG